jgi:hypothetical protein
MQKKILKFTTYKERCSCHTNSALLLCRIVVFFVLLVVLVYKSFRKASAATV